MRFTLATLAAVLSSAAANCPYGVFHNVSFETDVNGPVVDGDYVTDLGNGMTVATEGGYSLEGPRIYDTNKVGGEDEDLEAGIGNVLIIQESADRGPDDNMAGGFFFFNFSTPVYMESVTFLDTEQYTVVSLQDSSGAKLLQERGPEVGDYETAVLPLETGNVSKLRVEMRGSGAVAEIAVCIPTCVHTGDALDAGCSPEAPTCVNGDGSAVDVNTPGEQCVAPTPAPTTPAPVTPAPTTAAPVTDAPVTDAPVTPAPVTPAPVTAEPTTAAPVSDAPVTEAPATDATVTDAPVTTAPVTEAPVTDAPVASVATTDAPVTDAPVTTAPVTEAPVTDAPVATVATTEAPVTSAPVTDAPVTTNDAPVATVAATEAPVTSAPVTEAPVNTVVATEAPVTSAPVTEAPVTEASVAETDAPVATVAATDAPVTSAPVTEAPVTEAPVTASPVANTMAPTFKEAATVSPTGELIVEEFEVHDGPCACTPTEFKLQFMLDSKCQEGVKGLIRCEDPQMPYEVINKLTFAEYDEHYEPIGRIVLKGPWQNGDEVLLKSVIGKDATKVPRYWELYTDGESAGGGRVGALMWAMRFENTCDRSLTMPLEGGEHLGITRMVSRPNTVHIPTLTIFSIGFNHYTPAIYVSVGTCDASYHHHHSWTYPISYSSSDARANHCTPNSRTNEHAYHSTYSLAYIRSNSQGWRRHLRLPTQ